MATACNKTKGKIKFDFPAEFKGTNMGKYTGRKREVVIPDGVTSLNSTFYVRVGQKSKVDSVVVPSSVKMIFRAFYNCNTLSKVALSEGLESVEEFSFAYCRSLKELILPRSIKYIAKDAFSGVEETMLIKVYSNSYAEAFAKNANLRYELIFDEISQNENLAISNQAKKIYTDDELIRIWEPVENDDGTLTVTCYKNDDDLLGVMRGDSIIIDIPETVSGKKVTVLGNRLFSRLNSRISSETKYIDILKSVIKINVPDTVIAIGRQCFYELEKLEEVTMPQKLVSIDSAAFSGCKSLISIDLPSSLKSIGEDCFRGCKSIKKMVIPNKIKVLKSMTFAWCECLEELYIPASVKSVGIIIHPDEIASSKVKIYTEEDSGAYVFCQEYGFKVVIN